ncbi:MAG: intermembrane transport protein PqiB [Thermodesulfobacteriota bacterium]|nr:intermembrane transport protein PqiB [Thermodesulfobacteriota bacterium]
MTNNQAVISQKRRFSMVWIVPIVALLLGGWMIIHNYQNRGPIITIQFASAEGIEAEKTHIKALSVDVGVVKSVEINPQFDGVLIRAQVNKEIAPLLRDDSQFWVVRPRIGASGISGLGTLLSGAYIELSPGSAEQPRRNFIGLNDIPPTPVNTPGVHLTLISHEESSLNTGEPVLYRGFQVGRVEKTVFDTDQRLVRSSIFIDAPYDDLITTSTRFWNASGISIKMDAKGLSLDSESLETLLVGGIAFALPDDTVPGTKVKDGTEFNLYPDQQSINIVSFTYSADYLLLFDSSVRGLLPGAPVTFRGLEIGHVVGISFDFMPNNSVYLNSNDAPVPVPVLIRLTPAALNGDDSPQTVEQMQQQIATGINSGLRASLKTGNLLTGSLYVSLDFSDHPDPVKSSTMGDYQLIPTISGGFDQIQSKVGQLLDKFNALPLKQTVNDTGQTMRQISSTAGRATEAIAHLDTILASESTRQLPSEFNKTLQQLRLSLNRLAGDFSAGSPVYRQLGHSLDQLQQTLHSVEQLTNQLSTRPSTLIFSDPHPDDRQPEATR